MNPRRLAPVSGNEVEERAGLLATQFAVEHTSWLYGLDPDDDLEVVQRVRAPSTAGLIGCVHSLAASLPDSVRWADSSLAITPRSRPLVCVQVASDEQLAIIRLCDRRNPLHVRLVV